MSTTKARSNHTHVSPKRRRAKADLTNGTYVVFRCEWFGRGRKRRCEMTPLFRDADFGNVQAFCAGLSEKEQAELVTEYVERVES